jgi:hypothetical protein
MPDQPKVALRNYQPLWEGRIKGILREIDQVMRDKIQLMTDTLAATDSLESIMPKIFLPQCWSANLLTRLEILEDGLLKEHMEEVQRALDLTQELILELKGD